jgi:hypothetical protein
MATPARSRCRRSFGTAISQTNSGGEIVVLDSAGYGRVTISKSVTIVSPPGVYAGISVFSGTNGIDIATAGVDVVLRGLTINGQGGNLGIAFSNGDSLAVEDCIVSNMNGIGIVLNAANANVTIRNTIVRSNGGGGIQVGGGDIVDVAIDRVTTERNQSGLSVSTGGRVHVRDSSIVRNANAGVTVSPLTLGVGTAAFAQLTMTRTSVVGNGGVGVSVTGNSDKSALASIADSEIADSASDGVSAQASASNAALVAISNSRVHNNGGDGASFVNSSGTVRGDLLSNTITRNAAFGVLASGGAAVFTNGANLVKHNLGVTDVSGAVSAGPI